MIQLKQIKFSCETRDKQFIANSLISALVAGFESNSNASEGNSFGEQEREHNNALQLQVLSILFNISRASEAANTLFLLINKTYKLL